jgi:hypothetical protein
MYPNGGSCFYAIKIKFLTDTLNLRLVYMSEGFHKNATVAALSDSPGDVTNKNKEY